MSISEQIDNIVKEITEDDFLGKIITNEQAPALKKALLKARRRYVDFNPKETEWPISSAKKLRKELKDFEKSFSKINDLIRDMGANTWLLICDSISEQGKDDDFIDSWTLSMFEIEPVVYHLARDHKGKPGRPVNQAFFEYIKILAEFWTSNTNVPFRTGWSLMDEEDGQRVPISPVDKFMDKVTKSIAPDNYPSLPYTMRLVARSLNLPSKAG